MSEHAHPWTKLAIALAVATAAMLGLVHMPAWGKRASIRSRSSVSVSDSHATAASVLAVAAGRCPGAARPPRPRHVNRAKSATLCLINAERRAAGLPRLHDNRRLDRAARRHSHDMVVRNYFAHDAPGSRFEGRIRRSGYLARAMSWDIGENIGLASGPTATPAAMVAAWMNSPEHRANILTRDFRDSGIGIAAHIPRRFGGGPGAVYTQDFGHRG